MPSCSRRLLGGLATATLLVGCAATDDNDAASVSTRTGITVEVIAIDNTFRPDAIEVPTGTTVRWENRGRNDHNVLSVDESWGAPTGAFLPGDEYGFVFADPGTFSYYCSIHGTKEREWWAGSW